MVDVKVDSGERDGVPRVEDAELDEEIPSDSSGGSMSIEGVVDVEDGGRSLEGSMAIRIEAGAK